MTGIAVSVWDAAESSALLHAIWQATVAKSHRAYSLPPHKFHTLVTAPLARVLVTTGSDGTPTGFALTYLIRAGSQWSPANAYYKGSLALLVVHPDRRNQGLGTALHAAALQHLTEEIQRSFKLATPTPEKSQIQLGSIFPRIFPGLPDAPAFEDARKWFEARGWTFGDKKSIDLYQPLALGRREDLEQVMSKALEAGFRFGEPEGKDLEAVYQLQKDNFETFTGWPDMFPKLIEAGRKRDIHVAWDKDGRVVGATVAALDRADETQPGPMHQALAWPATLGSACGSIGCVGVASSTRGSGAGIALVASATQSLIDRGADGCFIDWVSLEGFYQKCGYRPWELAYLDAWRTVDNPDKQT